MINSDKIFCTASHPYVILFSLSLSLSLIELTTTAKAREVGEQTNDKDDCSTVVIILASLVTATYAALLTLALYFYSWQKKKRKGELLSSLYAYVYVNRYISVLQSFRSQWLPLADSINHFDVISSFYFGSKLCL